MSSPDAQEHQYFDTTETLEPTSPFKKQLRDIIDRELPHDIEQKNGRLIIERRFGDQYVMALEAMAITQANLAFDELRALEKPIEGRAVSLPEAVVGYTLLAGEVYRKPLQAPFMYMTESVAFGIGKVTETLYREIAMKRNAPPPSDLQKMIYAAVIGGPYGISDALKTLGNADISVSGTSQQIDKQVEGLVRQREANGQLIEGAGDWFREASVFFTVAQLTPFVKVLSDFGHYGVDPYSDAGKETIRKLYETQVSLGRKNTDIEKMARGLGIIE